MARYIDAEPILQKYAAEINKSGKYTDYECGLDDAYFYVNNAPTADVQEVKHGKWIYVGDPNFAHIVGFLYECSCCKRHITVDYQFELREYPYCHCGAKMDKKEDE